MLRIRRPTDEPEQQQLQVAELWREIGGIGHQFQLLLNDLRFLEIVRCLDVIFKEQWNDDVGGHRPRRLQFATTAGVNVDVVRLRTLSETKSHNTFMLR